MDIKRCARCGKNHQGLAVHSFDRCVVINPEEVYTHWATCPRTGDPILILYKELPESEKEDFEYGEDDGQ